MRIQKSSHACTVLIICAVINGLVNAGLLISFCFQGPPEYAYVAFGIAWGLWQIANIVVSAYCITDKSASHGLRLYLQVNMCLVGVLGGIILIGALLGWSICLLDCAHTGKSCQLWNFLFGSLVLADLCINLCGFMMLFEAYKNFANDVSGFKKLEINT